MGGEDRSANRNGMTITKERSCSFCTDCGPIGRLPNRLNGWGGGLARGSDPLAQRVARHTRTRGTTAATEAALPTRRRSPPLGGGGGVSRRSHCAGWFHAVISRGPVAEMVDYGTTSGKFYYL